MYDPNSPALDWPLPPDETGREVWYGLVSSRDASVAFWYRYTLLATEGGHREGRLWAALTDRADEDTTFVSRAFDLDAVQARGTPFALRLGDGEGERRGELTTSSARGEVEHVSWDLAYDPDTFVFTPLRSDRLTELLSRFGDSGKHWSRNESVRMDGEVRVGDRTVCFESAPGHQGHTLGADPPESWTWVQCNDFDDPSVALECLNVDGRLSMCLRRDGAVHELNRLHHVLSPRRNRAEYDEPGRWKFRGRGDGAEVTATVEADDHWQRVVYRTPDDSFRYNAHCSLSTVTLTYRVGSGDQRTLSSDAGRAEWVSVEKPVPGDYRPGWE